MADLNALRRQLMDNLQEDLNSGTVEYVKVGNSSGVTVSASFLGARRLTDDGEGYLMEFHFTDFAVRKAALVTPGDQPFFDWLGRKPKYGDLIRWDGREYRVGDDNGDTVFDWTDTYQTSMRIHTVYRGPTS